MIFFSNENILWFDISVNHFMQMHYTLINNSKYDSILNLQQYRTDNAQQCFQEEHHLHTNRNWKTPTCSL